MSAAQLQSALMTLVRYPERNRGPAATAFVDQFDLTQSEKSQLLSLANSRHVQKFGAAQRAKRFDTSIRHMLPLTVRLIGAEKMARDVFGGRFEPLHLRLGVADITRTFGTFLFQHAHLIQDDLKLPAHFADLARYEYAEHLVKGRVLESEWHVPEKSLLSEKCIFTIVELEHDILDFVEKAKLLTDDQLPDLAVVVSPSILLIAKAPKPMSEGSASLVYQFVIDNILKRFLDSQLNGCPEDHELPECFSDLVSLGICRPPDSSTSTSRGPLTSITD